MAGCDLKRDIAHELLELVICDSRFLACADLDQNSDFGAGMNIGCNHSVARDFHAMESGNADVLADLGNLRDAISFQIGFGVSGQPFGNIVAERAEVVVARDEISLAVHFHENADAGSRLNVLDNHTLVRFAASFLGGGSDPALTQEVDRRIEISIGFGERFFAIHQPRISHFAELAYVRCSNFSHNSKYRSKLL